MSTRLIRAGLVGVVASLGLLVLWGQLDSAVEAEDLVIALLVTELLVVGSVLILKAPGNRVSWLLFTIAATGVIAGAVELWSPDLSDLVSGIWLFALLLPGLAGLLPLWFPTGSPPAKWHWVSWLYVPGVVLIFGGTSYADFAEGLDTYDLGCVTPGSCAAIGGLVLMLLMVMGAIASFVARWVRAEGVERHQLKWLVLPFLFLGIGVLAEFGGAQDSLVANVFGVLGPVSIPPVIAFAVLRYRLYEIDRIISRTVSYSLVIGLLALGVGLVATVTAAQFEDPLVVAATTLAVAAVFNPLRKRIQGWVDRRFNRSHYDAERVMDEFAASLQEGVDAEEVVEGWVDVVSETMEPVRLGVWVR